MVKQIKPQEHKCTKCEKSFTKEARLEAHKKTECVFGCSKCYNYFTDIKMKDHHEMSCKSNERIKLQWKTYEEAHIRQDKRIIKVVKQYLSDDGKDKIYEYIVDGGPEIDVYRASIETFDATLRGCFNVMSRTEPRRICKMPFRDFIKQQTEAAAQQTEADAPQTQANAQQTVTAPQQTKTAAQQTDATVQQTEATAQQEEFANQMATVDEENTNSEEMDERKRQAYSKVDLSPPEVDTQWERLPEWKKIQTQMTDDYYSTLGIDHQNTMLGKLYQMAQNSPSGKLTPVEMFPFVNRWNTERRLEIMFRKLSHVSEYVETWKEFSRYYDKIRELEMVDGDKSDEVKTLWSAARPLMDKIELIQRQNGHFISEIKDKNGKFIGIPSCDFTQRLLIYHDGDINRLVDYLCQFTKSTNFYRDDVPFFEKLFFRPGITYRDLPFRVIDQRRINLKYQLPDGSWVNDFGGKKLARLLCSNVQNTLGKMHVIFSELLLQESDPDTKEALWESNHYLNHINEHIAKLGDSKYQNVIIRNIVNMVINLRTKDTNRSPDDNDEDCV